MKKLHFLIFLSALLTTSITSCSYQNYGPGQSAFAPLTGDVYASNVAWNSDHYNVSTKKYAPMVPQYPDPSHPIFMSAK